MTIVDFALFTWSSGDISIRCQSHAQVYEAQNNRKKEPYKIMSAFLFVCIIA